MFVIYKHIAPNGKVYIGMTRQSLKKRWKNGRGYENNKLFFDDIIKYGWDNIAHETVCYCRTKAEAEAVESKLIKQYKSDNEAFGYNVSTGGAGRTKVGKPVICIESGKIYKTACEAEKATQIKKTHIGGCCRNERITAGGFHWAFLSNYESGVPTKKQKKQKAVYCEELNKTFTSATEAAKFLGASTSGVTRACNGKINKTKGYHLIYI